MQNIVLGLLALSASAGAYAAVNDGVVTIQYIDSAWTRITDGLGRVEKGFLDAGTIKDFKGPLPLKVDLGASRVDIKFNGKPFDFLNYINDDGTVQFVLESEEATTEPQQEVVEPILTHKGVFNCISQDSRHHSIERNIATFGGVSDLNSGDSYKYEYAGTEDFIDGEKIPNSRHFRITGLGFLKGTTVCEEPDSFQRCGGERFFDISANKFKIIHAGHILTLARTYKEDWAGFELYLDLKSPPTIFVTPLTCKRTVLVGE